MRLSSNLFSLGDEDKISRNIYGTKFILDHGLVSHLYKHFNGFLDGKNGTLWQGKEYQHSGIWIYTDFNFNISQGLQYKGVTMWWYEASITLLIHAQRYHSTSLRAVPEIPISLVSDEKQSDVD